MSDGENLQAQNVGKQKTSSKIIAAVNTGRVETEIANR